MLPAALGLLIGGFAFAFFSVTTGGGLDILIDAVGFLLVYNATRALRKANPGMFGGAGLWALLLVPLCALQLFLLFDAPRLILLVVRAVAEAFLYLALARGMGKALQEDNRVFSRIAWWVFLLNAAGALVWAALSFFTPALGALWPPAGASLALNFNDTGMVLLHLAVMVLLILLLLAAPLANTHARYVDARAKRVADEAQKPKPETEAEPPLSQAQPPEGAQPPVSAG